MISYMISCSARFRQCRTLYRKRHSRNFSDSQIGVRRIDNDNEPAVPFSCLRVQCVSFVRLPRFLSEQSKDSRLSRLGCNLCCRCIGDLGAVEGGHETPALRGYLALRPRSCNSKRKSICGLNRMRALRARCRTSGPLLADPIRFSVSRLLALTYK
jgi:hypothetical protein